MVTSRRLGHLRRIPNLSIPQSTAILEDSIIPSTAPLLAGPAAFIAIIHLSSYVQCQIGLSTGFPFPLPTFAGAVSVAAASICAHATSIVVSRRVSGSASQRRGEPSLPHQPFDLPPLPNYFAHAVRIAVLGTLSYKILRGRFWSVSPSSYTALGSFAGPSIPATDAYATTSQRDLVTKLGRRYGCHTCGSREIFRRTGNAPAFHADHQPPKAVARQITERSHGFLRRLTGRTPVVQFKFYPQCVSCSNRQGAILSAAVAKNSQHAPTVGAGKIPIRAEVNLHAAGGRRGVAHVHHRMRREHAAGLVVAWFSIGEDLTNKRKNDDPLVLCEKRLREIETQIVGSVSTCLDRIKRTIDGMF